MFLYLNKTYIQYLSCCSLSSSFKIMPCDYLIEKIYFHLMRKKQHDRILKGELKKQHLSIVSKFCFLYLNPHVCVCVCVCVCVFLLRKLQYAANLTASP